MKVSLFTALRVATVTAFTSSSSRLSAHARKMSAATLSEPSTAIKFADESAAFKELTKALEEITHLNHASAVLSYDRQVFMPTTERTSTARGKQLAVLATIAHEKSVDPRIGELLAASAKDLEACDKEIEDLDDAKRILELESADYQKRTCLSKELAARKAELEASAYSAWVKARQENDFASFAPALGDCFDLAKEIATLQRGDKDISLYSQMLDEFEMGMQGTRIDELFAEVQSALVPFIARIRASEDKPSLAPLRGEFDVDAQKKVCLDIVKSLGYDASHGRLDVSVHPFTMSLSGSDVRITSRFNSEEWYQGLAGAIHEGGHGEHCFFLRECEHSEASYHLSSLKAMYEQNLQGSDLSIDSALSMGVHESQSLFWERHIGKCPAFFEWATPSKCPPLCVPPMHNILIPLLHWHASSILFKCLMSN